MNQTVAVENRKYEVRDTDHPMVAKTMAYFGVRAKIAGTDWVKTKQLYALLDALEVKEVMTAYGHLQIARVV